MTSEEEIKKLKEENEKLTKLNSIKTDIVSVSAHQIRTALSAIKWILKMIMDGDLGKMNTEQDNLMKKAYEDNDRAIGTVSELLLANKTEDSIEKKYNFTEVDIEELIDDCTFDFSGEARNHNMEIIFLKPEKKIPNVFIDKEKFRIVFQNLLENAIKYSNDNGKIFITSKQKDNFIQISVKDSGIGISEDGKEKIFGKFYRDPNAEKKEAVGSGIGLFTIKKIIEDHKGQIWFESKENEGTTFFFTIPIIPI